MAQSWRASAGSSSLARLIAVARELVAVVSVYSTTRPFCGVTLEYAAAVARWCAFQVAMVAPKPVSPSSATAAARAEGDAAPADDATPACVATPAGRVAPADPQA